MRISDWSSDVCSSDLLVGQKAMVRTLTNAFKTGRIAHAFMLTGVRGVGKTTTARLLARALNYETDTVHQPSIKLDPPGEIGIASCRARVFHYVEICVVTVSLEKKTRQLQSIPP